MKKAACSETDNPNQMATNLSMRDSPTSDEGILIPTRAHCQEAQSTQMLRFRAGSHICQDILFAGGYMPVVQIYMYAGRTKEQKSELVKRISKDFEEVVNVKSESLNILFHDVDKEDWGIRGSLASEPPLK